MQFRRMLAMINFISLTIRCLSTPFIFYCAIFSFDNYPISGRQTRICAHNLMDTFSLADETVVLYLNSGKTLKTFIYDKCGQVQKPQGQ